MTGAVNLGHVSSLTTIPYRRGCHVRDVTYFIVSGSVKPLSHALMPAFTMH